MSPEAPSYTILKLPNDPSYPDFSTILQKYRDLRLQALLGDPKVYFSSHEIESKFSNQEWEARLTRPNSQILVCIPSHPNAPVKAELLREGEFVGALSILGPIPEQDYESLMGREPIQESIGLETRWQLCNLFTAQEHRNNGIAVLLAKNAYEYAGIATVKKVKLEITRGNGAMRAEMRIRCMVKKEEKALMQSYRKYGGMVDTGARLNLAEVFGSTGDSKFVPRGWDEVEKWSQQDILVLEVVKEVGDEINA